MVIEYERWAQFGALRSSAPHVNDLTATLPPKINTLFQLRNFV